MNKLLARPITDEIITGYIEYTKDEFNKVITPADARKELEHLKDQGCLLYDGCRGCPLLGRHCPV